MTQRVIQAVAFVFALSAAAGAATANAEPCPGNPDALGVSRVITVSPSEYGRLGQMQYRHTLPLNDHEVVLTFDDGPLPPFTNRVLNALAHECVKATFFIVGRMAAAYPETLKLVAEQGHTIGNHSQNHPIHFDAISEERAEREVENGMRTIKAALGNEGTLAPFFRIPGLGRTRAVEHYLQNRSLVLWSADTVADDWTPISASQVMHRALRRLEAKGRGILLLHDIHARTVLMLPELLAELKARGFHIVHVVPERNAPQPVPASPEMMIASAAKPPWPRLLPSAATPQDFTLFGDIAPAASRGPTMLGEAAPARPVRHGKKPPAVQTATLVVHERYRPDAIP